ncbi:hypothetical protein PV325_003702 [Microctonus aethiopoides]|uniref:Uncharacterized protein n=1 Tax=Microctonus aethiopoides TaxID=144406 RepID=A0AA39CAD6_9HYME|nr:hypothetical protein PV325_003702 [Microctonus aethiopoides]KAK0092190.1 hypothetical protein PV326_001973 [Microctonus aethiopoides]KAK0160385.1 hypothetical protein PV328_007798 [Microctonus aethiopoides]
MTYCQSFSMRCHLLANPNQEMSLSEIRAPSLIMRLSAMSVITWLAVANVIHPPKAAPLGDRCRGENFMDDVINSPPNTHICKCVGRHRSGTSFRNLARFLKVKEVKDGDTKNNAL